MNIEAGSWIRFYVNGTLVIAQVEYVVATIEGDDGPYACTQQFGAVPFRAIIEARSRVEGTVNVASTN